MIRREFILEEDHEYGSAGLRPKWLQDANAYPGMAAAHDILEHFPTEVGPVEGEFMASGAMLYIRGEGGYWDRSGNINPPHVHLASEMPDIWMRVCRGDQYFRPFPHRSCAVYAPWGGATEDMLQATIREFRKNWKDRLDEEGEGAEEEYRRPDYGNIVAWMRNGYRCARRRYAGHDAYSMSRLFEEIEKKADRLINSEETFGQTVIALVNVRRGTVSLEVEEPDGYY